jgi:hypothetical protein
VQGAKGDDGRDANLGIHLGFPSKKKGILF